MRPRDPTPCGPFPLWLGVPVWDGPGRRFVFCKVSRQDYALGVNRRWRLDSKNYPCGHYFDPTRRKSVVLYLHRVIARASADEQVDHKHHDLLDCRRSQLRRATPSQNSANTRRFRLHSSRFRGVTRHRSGRWQAQCRHQGTNHYLGVHATEEAAARSYDQFARAHHGPFAVLNNVPSLVTAQGRAA